MSASVVLLSGSLAGLKGGPIDLALGFLPKYNHDGKIS